RRLCVPRVLRPSGNPDRVYRCGSAGKSVGVVETRRIRSRPIRRRKRIRRRRGTMKALFATLLLLFALSAPQPSVAAPPQAADVGFCKPYTWLFGGWVAPPRMPLLGDINGDGYADFVYASPRDK